MKKIFALLFVVIVAVMPCRIYAQDVPLLVEIPTPPAQLERLDERCNYIVDNFWKRLNYKGAFSSLDRLEATLGQFMSVTPYASADTVYMAINTLVKGVEKADAKNLVTLAKMVEKLCGTDTSEYESEDLMLPFAQAVANCKKIKGPDKEYFTKMAKRLTNSRVGVIPADFSFTMPSGNTANFSDIKDETVLIFFYDPNDFESRLARTRLGNNYVIKTLGDYNMLRVVAIYPSAPDDTWLADIESMPDNWVIGAAPGIDDMFTIRRMPQIYYLDGDRKITDKDFSADAAIIYFDQFLKQQNQ